jgi:hypothetical protein
MSDPVFYAGQAAFRLWFGANHASAVWWVVSAVRESTRQRTLATLIADSVAGRSIKRLARPLGKVPRAVPEAGKAGE